MTMRPWDLQTGETCPRGVLSMAGGALVCLCVGGCLVWGSWGSCNTQDSIAQQIAPHTTTLQRPHQTWVHVKSEPGARLHFSKQQKVFFVVFLYIHFLIFQKYSYHKKNWRDEELYFFWNFKEDFLPRDKAHHWRLRHSWYLTSLHVPAASDGPFCLPAHLFPRMSMLNHVWNNFHFPFASYLV